MTATVSTYSGPFPDFCAVVEREWADVVSALVSYHGVVKRKQPPAPQKHAPATALEQREEGAPASAKDEPTVPFPPQGSEPHVKLEPGSDSKPESARDTSRHLGQAALVKKEEDGGSSGLVTDAEAGKTEGGANAQECPPCGCDTSHWGVLDSLVRTILSQNTTDVTSARAFASLQQAFPGGWEQVRTAPVSALAESIRVGGLADIKAARIQAILNTLHTERGECSLEHLRDLTDQEAKDYLCRFKGVGPKTAACVLMFCMQREEFPVDTHVLHISKRLGWIPSNASREAAYEHLNACLPGHIKHDLHVLMVEHGKVCCKLNTHTTSRITNKKRPRPALATKATTPQIGEATQQPTDTHTDSESLGADTDTVRTCPLQPFYSAASKRRKGGSGGDNGAGGKGSVAKKAASKGADNRKTDGKGSEVGTVSKAAAKAASKALDTAPETGTSSKTAGRAGRKVAGAAGVDAAAEESSKVAALHTFALTESSKRRKQRT